MTTSGVYEIRNLITDSVYIGSSQSIGRRWSYHRTRLRKNKHPNRHLQAAWNKYGENNFNFLLLVKCEIIDLIRIEQIYIDKVWNSGKCYNFAQFAGAPSRGTKLSDERKRQISAANAGENHWAFGITRPKSVVELINKTLATNCKTKKLSDVDVVQIRQRYAAGGIGAGRLAKEYGVSKPTIQRILKGTRYRFT